MFRKASRVRTPVRGSTNADARAALARRCRSMRNGSLAPAVRIRSRTSPERPERLRAASDSPGFHPPRRPAPGWELPAAQALTSRNESSSAGLSGRLRLSRMTSKAVAMQAIQRVSQPSTGTTLERAPVGPLAILFDFEQRFAQKLFVFERVLDQQELQRLLGSGTWGSARRRFVRLLYRLDRELILLQLAVQRGAPDAQQIGRDGAIALGVCQRFHDGLPFHLSQRNDRRACAFRSAAVFMRSGLRRAAWARLEIRRPPKATAPSSPSDNSAAWKAARRHAARARC